MYGWGVSCYILWSIKIAGESRESNQRNVWERKKRLRNREMTKMSCFKGVVIKNYTTQRTVPSCQVALTSEGNQLTVLIKKIKKTFYFRNASQHSRSTAAMGEIRHPIQRKRLSLKWERPGGEATGGGTYWETPRFSRGHSPAKDFQEISLSVIRLTLP